MRISVRQYGRALSTRSRGAEVRQRIERSIESDRDALILFDLAGVIAFSHSFGDELFGLIIQRLRAGRYGRGRRAAFIHANEMAEETLDPVLRIRRTTAALVREDGTWKVVGAIEPKTVRVLEVLRRRGEAQTGDLARQLRLSLPAMNNHLRELVNAGVVERERLEEGSGRPFVYRVRPPAPVGV